MGFPNRLLVVGVALLAACDRAPAERANDTTAAPSPPPVEPVPPVAMEVPWDSATGPVFLVMGATADQAAVIVPALDSTASLDTLRTPPANVRAAAFDLFRDGRRLATTTAGDPVAIDIPDDCSAWPTIRLARSDTAAWTVAMAAGSFDALGVDSLPALSPADSARLTRELARLASAVPGDTADALRGLPYVVQRAWRTTLPNGRHLVVAEVDRTLNQEASPVQEHLVLVAERDSTSGARWATTWAHRTAGGEETSESIELLAVGTPRGREQPVAFIARYLGDGVIYALLGREPNGMWRLRWTSPYAGC